MQSHPRRAFFRHGRTKTFRHHRPLRHRCAIRAAAGNPGRLRPARGARRPPMWRSTWGAKSPSRWAKRVPPSNSDEGSGAQRNGPTPPGQQGGGATAPGKAAGLRRSGESLPPPAPPQTSPVPLPHGRKTSLSAACRRIHRPPRTTADVPLRKSRTLRAIALRKK